MTGAGFSIRGGSSNILELLASVREKSLIWVGGSSKISSGIFIASRNDGDRFCISSIFSVSKNCRSRFCSSSIFSTNIGLRGLLSFSTFNFFAFYSNIWQFF